MYNVSSKGLRVQIHILQYLLIISVPMLASCESPRHADSPLTAPEAGAWIAEGPTAWATKFAPTPTIPENGFPFLIQLGSLAPPSPATAPELAWALDYARGVEVIALRMHWSGHLWTNGELSEAFGETIGAGITDEKLQISNSEIINVGRWGERATAVMMAAGDQEAAARAAAGLLALAERLGRNGGDQDKVIASAQVAISIVAVKSMVTIAANKKQTEDVNRLIAIRQGMEEYGTNLVARMRENR